MCKIKGTIVTPLVRKSHQNIQDQKLPLLWPIGSHN